MRYDAAARRLEFSSDQEVEEFHAELSHAVRGAMAAAAGHIEDAQAATEASRQVLKELGTLLRVMNLLRRSGTLVRKGS